MSWFELQDKLHDDTKKLVFVGSGRTTPGSPRMPAPWSHTLCTGPRQCRHIWEKDCVFHWKTVRKFFTSSVCLSLVSLSCCSGRPSENWRANEHHVWVYVENHLLLWTHANANSVSYQIFSLKKEDGKVYGCSLSIDSNALISNCKIVIFNLLYEWLNLFYLLFKS